MRKSNVMLYSIIKWLWLIVLLPKELQFVLFGSILLWMGIKHPLRIRCFLEPFIIYAVIHLVSIFWNALAGDYELTRIFAAINTCGIWLFALLIAGSIEEENIDLDIVGYCFVRNIVILFMMLLVTYLFHITSIDYLIETRIAWRVDWISSGKTMRFRGFFEYDTLVGLFVILQLPLAVNYLVKKINVIFQLGFMIIAITPIMATLSRTGIFLSVIEIGLTSWYILDSSHISKRWKVAIKSLEIILLGVFAIVFSNQIYSGIYRFIFLRKGSNVARKNIYITSLLTVWNESPFIGMGIKDMTGEFPLGSHCTYIGIFYKTGFIGLFIWLFGFWQMLQYLFRRLWTNKFNKLGRYIFSNIVLFLGYLITEDLDGADWLIVLYFSLVIIYGGRRCCGTGIPSEATSRHKDMLTIKCEES